jgi:hypothetical protein
VKAIILGGVAVIALATPDVASAQPGRAGSLFHCTLANGKNVSVTICGEQIIYRYGRGSRAELTLNGTPRSRNVFYGGGRYVSPQYQLRFQNGRYSYIVHTMEANPRMDSSGISGLVVMRDARTILDLSCRRWTGFTGSYELRDALPIDEDERYSAMSGGEGN